MPNPNPRTQIRQRLGMDALTAPLNATGGRGIGIATGRTSAMGDLSGQSPVVGFTRSREFDKWAVLSSTLATITKMGADIVLKKHQEATEEEKKRQAELEAQQNVIDSIHGAALGQQLLYDVDEKTRTGEMSGKEAQDYIVSKLEEHRFSPAFMKATSGYALKATEVASANDRQRIQEAQRGNFLAVARQGFASMYENYDPENPGDLLSQRSAIHEGREALGMSEADIGAMELESIIIQARKVAKDDPLKSQALLALAEEVGPDGSPSIAASLPDGYTKLDALRHHLNATVTAEAKLEEAESRRLTQESTKDAFTSALVTLAQLEDVEAVKEWEAENITGKSQDELRAVYGDHRADIVNTVSKLKANPKPEGNDEATSEYSEAIQRGTAEWEDIKNDSRLNPKQKAQLFASMKDVTQRTDRGYVSDAQLASKLLNDLEEAWSESGYKTPWGGSKHLEPGKPPVITPEGLFYQGQLFRRLKELDPNLDVVENNRKKQELLREVRDDILSRRIRFQEHADSLGEPAPELNLDAKVEENVSFTDAEIKALGKCFNDGGYPRMRDVYKVDIFKVAGPDQLRIIQEAQRQKAEMDAMEAEGLWFNNSAASNRGTYVAPAMTRMIY